MVFLKGWRHGTISTVTVQKILKNSFINRAWLNAATQSVLVGTITWIGHKSSPFCYRERKKLWDEQLCKTSVWHIWKKWLRMLCKHCVLVLCRGRSSLLPSFGDQQEICWLIYILCFIQSHIWLGTLGLLAG